MFLYFGWNWNGFGLNLTNFIFFLFHSIIRPGIIIARASRDIEIGEEITISLGPNFKESSTKSRQLFLNERNFEKCFCMECTAEMDYFEHIHNFECKNCGFPIDVSLSFNCNKCKNHSIRSIEIFAVKDFLNKCQKNFGEPRNFNREFNVNLSILRVLSTVYPIDGILAYEQILKILKLLVNESEFFFIALGWLLS